jgi:D-serine deaminase-like pyridoxal phosphate-dependent protein
MHNYSFYKNIFGNQIFPLAFLDLDVLDQNISDIVKRAGNKKIRIASTSIRSPWVLRYILEKSQQFQGLMTFNARETVYLAENGFDDLLLAYPTINKKELSLLAKQVKNGKNIRLTVDSIPQVQIINAVAQENNIVFNLALDVDLSEKFPFIYFGVYRSSQKSLESIETLICTVKVFENVKLNSVMAYEAQIAETCDNQANFLNNTFIRFLKQKSIKNIAKKRYEVIDLFKRKGFRIKHVNGGGTGSLESTVQENIITEVTVGSGFYSPALFDEFQNFHHLPATGFALEITRIPGRNIYTALGGGYVASGSVSKNKLPKILFPEDAKLFENEGAGQVQTPIFTKESLNFGDPIILRHAKAGELFERFNEIKIIQGDEIIDSVKTYRGNGQCFM